MKNLSLLAALTAVVALTAMPATAQKCISEEKSNEFDFWIGEWTVTAGGQTAGTNRIVPILDGCVIQENWEGESGSKGSSFNFYNPQEDRWEQFWVWRNGTTIHTKGGYEDGKMILEGEAKNRNGEMVLNRITFHDNEDGTVRQHWEMSSDGGENWATAFDGLYRRVSD